MSYFGIETAFPSTRNHECYFFVNGRCVLLNYAPGTPEKRILKGPHPIERVFPMLYETPFKRRINCAFNGDENMIFIFSGNQCAKIRYTPNSIEGRLLKGPISITEMFPKLKRTSLRNGIDAAIRYTGEDVFLFKGEKYVRLNYRTKEHEQEQEICKGFPCLVGTVFEKGIDAAFASHVKDEAYIFKEIYYARINVAKRHTVKGDFFVGGRIRFIRDVWPPSGI